MTESEHRGHFVDAEGWLRRVSAEEDRQLSGLYDYSDLPLAFEEGELTSKEAARLATRAVDGEEILRSVGFPSHVLPTNSEVIGDRVNRMEEEYEGWERSLWGLRIDQQRKR